jgi:hypothetical protein
MYRRLNVLGLAAAVGLAILSGCNTCNQGNTTAARPYNANCATCYDTIQPPRISPVPMTGVVTPLPAAPLPAAPPPAEIGAPVPAPPPAATPPPPVDTGAAADAGSPRNDLPPSVRLGPPGPIRRDSALAPTEGKEPPVASLPPGPAPSTREERERETPGAFDIPSYAIARPNVASGLRPFPDGVDWLKKRGFKAVLHLRSPGADDANDRKMFEKKGLRYISLDASPARLDKELYERFNRLVTDTDNHPLYVYDKDGSVAGGLWHLHFRVYLKQSDEKARSQSQRLGLRINDDDVEHKTMWLAVQGLLKTLDAK